MESLKIQDLWEPGYFDPIGNKVEDTINGKVIGARLKQPIRVAYGPYIQCSFAPVNIVVVTFKQGMQISRVVSEEITGKNGIYEIYDSEAIFISFAFNENGKTYDEWMELIMKDSTELLIESYMRYYAFGLFEDKTRVKVVTMEQYEKDMKELKRKLNI